MPFEEDEDVSDLKNFNAVKLKNPIGKQNFKKPSQEDFEKKVKSIQEQNSLYKQKAAELAVQFKKVLEDKTLPQNKNIFSIEMEKEVLSKMVQLAIDINNDPNEQEGMGSLSWITYLFKISLSQRDRLNKLEYAISLLEKKTEDASMSELIKKQLQDIDKSK